MIEKLQKWIIKNPPDQMPFWPGAKVTTSFGLRTSEEVLEAGGNPGHLGTDRSKKPTPLIMPFDGIVHYSVVGGVAGTVTQIIASDIDLELQVFHAKMCNGKLKASYKRGSELPIIPDELGFSFGIHTHCECLMPYSKEVVEWLKAQSSIIDDKYVENHCVDYNLDLRAIKNTLERQFDTWCIEELWNHFAVRSSIPDYRTPHWGKGKTIHIDSMWLLKI